MVEAMGCGLRPWVSTVRADPGVWALSCRFEELRQSFRQPFPHLVEERTHRRGAGLCSFTARTQVWPPSVVAYAIVPKLAKSRIHLKHRQKNGNRVSDEAAGVR